MHDLQLKNQLPQKQGLRHIADRSFIKPPQSQKPTSTKTRIKTLLYRIIVCLRTTQKPTSTKTRIKTKSRVTFNYPAFNLKNQLPQKQGLRQDYLITIFYPRNLKNQLPQKQGLRLS